MEKAWAKLFKNYENIESGTTREVLHAFTGAPTEYYYNKNSLMSEIEIWQLVNLLIKYK